ncbi:uncharacterized protein LOC129803694 [Phlebotomus papatasi]|uniref:uncharacterized protein LOC129803694 n=1 Tax=Phlebotomus papatasi TaxID=29031 RepID=UPI0024836779|nr:uncharacterized protein LOC129803694 [Phlebotomus papatasi]
MRGKRAWSTSMQRDLMRFYKKNPELWNTKHPDYNVKEKRDVILQKLKQELCKKYSANTELFDENKIIIKYLSMKAYYRAQVKASREGGRCPPYIFFKDFANFDKIIAQTKVEEPEEPVIPQNSPKPEDLLSIKLSESTGELYDPDTKVLIHISSDDENFAPPVAESPKPSQPSPNPVPAKRYRTAQSTYIETSINPSCSSSTPVLPESSGETKASTAGIPDDARKLENQKFCDFLASRMNDMPKESSRDFQFKILMLLNQDY